jgi:hypothetical protein
VITVLAVGSAWTLLSLPLAVLVGRSIRCGDDGAAPSSCTESVERYLAQQAVARP